MSVEMTLEQAKSTISKFNFKSLAFSLVALPTLGMIYWVVNSQGIRISLPIFGMKLYKIPIPGFSNMQHYQNLRDLDLAHVFAILLLFAVFLLSVALVEILLFGVKQTDDRMNLKNHQRFLYSISAIVIITDVVMFYRGIADQGGLLDTAGGVTPLIATIGYTGVLAFVAYLHVLLKRRLV